MKRTIQTALACVLAFALAPAFAQSKPSQDTMQILREKLKADKKLVVAANMELKDSEAKAFWPVYEEYQKELAKLNKRSADLINAYAKAYRADDVKNDKARKWTDDLISNETAAVDAKRAVVAKLSKVLTGKKLLRYIQIENKIRAAVNYELADMVPLVRSRAAARPSRSRCRWP
jgi:hypothetical protein